jgi:hypothetical protein
MKKATTKPKRPDNRLGSRELVRLSNVRCHWCCVYGLGAFFELDQWYLPERNDSRWCLSFKFAFVCLLVTGNLYLGPARPNSVIRLH